MGEKRLAHKESTEAAIKDVLAKMPQRIKDAMKAMERTMRVRRSRATETRRIVYKQIF